MTLGDKYHWIVRYNDGGCLNQIESNGKRNAYQDINRDKLVAFEMWEGSTRVLFLKFNKGQQLIWRRRVETSPSGITEVCHIIGKQENIGGENLQGIIGLFESDGEGEKWSQ